jgi:hypothetical protein
MSNEAKQPNKTLHEKHLKKPLDKVRTDLSALSICIGQSRVGIWSQFCNDSGDNNDYYDSDTQLLLVMPPMSGRHRPRHDFILGA